MTTTADSITLPEGFWSIEAQHHLRARMTLRGMTYTELAVALTEHGTEIDPEELAAEVEGGPLSVGLFFQCLYLLGDERVEIADIEPYDG